MGKTFGTDWKEKNRCRLMVEKPAGKRLFVESLNVDASGLVWLRTWTSGVLLSTL